MKTLKALKRELLADIKAKASYKEMADEFAVVRKLMAARSGTPGSPHGEIGRGCGRVRI